MEVLHRPDAAAVGRAEVFFIEELDIAAVAVVGLERLETLGKIERASTNVDAAVLLQQRVTGGQHGMLKAAVHHGIEYAVQHHGIIQAIAAQVGMQSIDLLHDFADIQHALVLKVGLVGK